MTLVAGFAFFFVFPGHDPQPRGVPVGLVGSEASATEAADALEEVGDGGFEFHSYSDEDSARDAILDRNIYGALDPLSGQALVAGAASPQVEEILRGVFQGVVARQGVPLDVTDVRPLAAGDPRGLSVNLTTLPLTVTGILGALLLVGLAPQLGPRGRLLAVALFGVLGGLLAMLIVRVGIGALPGPFLGLAGLAALALIALAAAASAIIRLLGQPGVGLSFVIFLMLGNPASGAASAPELLPGFWQAVGPYLPPGALATGIRNIAYFDGVDLALPLIVLVDYILLGTVGLIIAERRAGGRPRAPEAAA